MSKCYHSICENHEYGREARMNFCEAKLFIDRNKSYLDGRRGILTFYNYCPFCGEKLKWEKLKRDLIN